MSRKQELALLYAKERRRVQSFYSRYRKKNYAIPENAIPARPKRITEGSIRRLQRMTPEFMKRKLVRYEKQLKREERRQQREEIKTAYSYDTPYNSFSDDNYSRPMTYAEIADLNGDPTYLKSYKDTEDRTLYAESFFGTDIINLDEKDLESIGYTKTSDGFIIDTDTGEIVARDMSAEIEANNNFIDELAQFEDMPADALDAFKSQEEQEQAIKDYVNQVNAERKANREKGRETEKERISGSGRNNWAQQVINNFVKDIRRFERSAYPVLIELINSLLSEVDNNLDAGKEALAKAIQETVNEYGRMTKETAYNGEALNQYADSIADKFHDNLSVLESLNDAVEESDNSW